MGYSKCTPIFVLLLVPGVILDVSKFFFVENRERNRLAVQDEDEPFQFAGRNNADRMNNPEKIRGEDDPDDTQDKGGTPQKEMGKNQRSGPKIWDHWGKWSACSVSCGIGKITRWRHCVSGGCATGEKEAQIKTCTLAAC